MKVNDPEWSIDQSRVVYGISRNDLHFLDISEDGQLILRIGDHSITFEKIIGEIRRENGAQPAYTSSFTLRIPQLIAHQIKKLKIAFEKAMEELDYKGRFLAVYPVKVNQRSDCVSEVVKADPEYGLEAGTKAELLLIKRIIGDERHRRIVCNGAKDPEYLDMILECIQEGYHMAISVESYHEAKLITDRFDPGITELVLRMKPYIRVAGHWSHSTGRDSKFGLSIHDMFDVIELFKRTGFLNSITTILAHVGSQIEAVSSFLRFGRYMARIFLQLRERGLSGLKIIDFGGGLAIDYTSSNQPDYMEKYARVLVQGIQEILKEQSTTDVVPDILIEAGRGITALGSLVLVKALEVRSVFPPIKDYSEKMERKKRHWLERIGRTSRVQDLVNVWNEFHKELEVNDPHLEHALELEMLIGELEKASRVHIVEKLIPNGETEFKSIKLFRSFWYPEHIVIGNFSVFNAIGDYVLVAQHFPIIPIKDLQHQPETTVRLVDITCDSDGEFSQFYRSRNENILFTKDYRPLTMVKPEFGKGIPIGLLSNIQGSYFVIALTGAYQDVIEMDHNLLGDLPDVEIIVNENGEWSLTWIGGAETMRDILVEVGYDIDSEYDPYMSDE